MHFAKFTFMRVVMEIIYLVGDVKICGYFRQTGKLRRKRSTWHVDVGPSVQLWKR